MKGKKTKGEDKKIDEKQIVNPLQSIKKVECENSKNSKILIVVGAKPNSKESKISQINDEYIGVNIAAPPKQGQANEQLISHIGYVLGVKKNCVYLDKGAKSKHKVLVIQNSQMHVQDVLQKLKKDLNS